MSRVAGALYLSLVALTACAGDPAEPSAGDEQGADELPEPLPVPKARRTLVGVSCPEGEDVLVPVAFFDADSTLRVSKSGSVSANDIEDVNILPFAARHTALLAKKGFLIAIVSNQGGVADGIISFETAEGALAFTASQLARNGGVIHYFDMAEKRDEFRKPETGMARKLDEILIEECGVGVDFSRSFMVGDSGFKKGVDGPHPDGRPADDFSNSDRLFAENLDIPFHEPTDFFDWRADEVFNIASEKELVAHLAKMEVRAAKLREENHPILAKRVEQEVAALRLINGLEP